jgi:hypothetical protein
MLVELVVGDKLRSTLKARGRVNPEHDYLPALDEGLKPQEL